MENTKYTKVDRSISMVWANALSIVLFVPIFLIPSIVFVWIWGPEPLAKRLDIFWGSPLIFLLVFIVLVFLHELLHGLTWQWLSKTGRDQIEYGFKWKTLTPYAHLKTPIELQSYRWGTAMPGVVLGVLPAVLGMLLGDGAIFVIGLFMTASAGGDIIVLYLLRNERSPALVEDHPSNAGCYVLVEVNHPAP